MKNQSMLWFLPLFTSSVFAAPVKSLCAADEMAAFTCQVRGSAKMASLCISPDLDKNHGYMYYIFGTPKRIEMKYPQDRQHPENLFNSNTMTTGPLPLYATGGYVSFASDNYRYFLYMLDWLRPEGQLPRVGVVVTRDGDRKAVIHLRCRMPQGGFQNNPNYDSDKTPDVYDVLGFDPENPSDRLDQAVTRPYDEDGKILDGGLPKLQHGTYLNESY